jgi:hypothetical protein
MLQSVRSFGLERLRAGGRLDAAHARHAAWAIELAEQVTPGLAHHEEATVAQLEHSLDDLRSAHRWMVSRSPHDAMRLIHALHPFALWHGRTEIFRWAEQLAETGCNSPLLASLHASVCAGAWMRGDLHAAERSARAALAAVTDVGSPAAGRAFEQAGEVALQRGDAETAVAMYDQAYRLRVLLGDHMQATWDLGSSALILHYTGDIDESDRRAAATATAADRLTSPSARSFAEFVLGELSAERDGQSARLHLERAVDLAQTVGNQFLAGLARVTLASLVPDGADDADAAAVDHYRVALAGWERTGAWFAQLVTLRSVVGLLISRRAFDRAATLYGVIDAARSTSPVYGADREKLERTRATLDHELGEARVDELAAVGRRLRRDEIVAFAADSLARVANA